MNVAANAANCVVSGILARDTVPASAPAFRVRVMEGYGGEERGMGRMGRRTEQGIGVRIAL